jgi:hypothetical protein
MRGAFIGQNFILLYLGVVDMKAKARIATVGGGKKKGSLRSDPAFGMWKDRADMQDVSAYVRQLRGARCDDRSAGAADPT